MKNLKNENAHIVTLFNGSWPGSVPSSDIPEEQVDIEERCAKLMERIRDEEIEFYSNKTINLLIAEFHSKGE